MSAQRTKSLTFFRSILFLISLARARNAYDGGRKGGREGGRERDQSFSQSVSQEHKQHPKSKSSKQTRSTSWLSQTELRHPLAKINHPQIKPQKKTFFTNRPQTEPDTSMCVLTVSTLRPDFALVSMNFTPCSSASYRGREGE